MEENKLAVKIDKDKKRLARKTSEYFANNIDKAKTPEEREAYIHGSMLLSLLYGYTEGI